MISIEKAGLNPRVPDENALQSRELPFSDGSLNSSSHPSKYMAPNDFQK